MSAKDIAQKKEMNNSFNLTSSLYKPQIKEFKISFRNLTKDKR